MIEYRSAHAIEWVTDGGMGVTIDARHEAFNSGLRGAVTVPYNYSQGPEPIPQILWDGLASQRQHAQAVLLILKQSCG